MLSKEDLPVESPVTSIIRYLMRLNVNWVGSATKSPLYLSASHALWGEGIVNQFFYCNNKKETSHPVNLKGKDANCSNYKGPLLPRIRMSCARLSTLHRGGRRAIAQCWQLLTSIHLPSRAAHTSLPALLQITVRDTLTRVAQINSRTHIRPPIWISGTARTGNRRWEWWRGYCTELKWGWVRSGATHCTELKWGGDIIEVGIVVIRADCCSGDKRREGGTWAVKLDIEKGRKKER